MNLRPYRTQLIFPAGLAAVIGVITPCQPYSGTLGQNIRVFL